MFNYFQVRIRNILKDLLDKIKYEEVDEYGKFDKDEFRTRLRQEAAKWACVLDDLTCKEQAHTKLKNHLENYKTNR